MKTNIFDLDKHEGYQSTNNILELLKRFRYRTGNGFSRTRQKDLGFQTERDTSAKAYLSFAVPDPGCGYRIILTNLYTNDLIDYKINILNELVDENGLYNRIRKRS